MKLLKLSVNRQFLPKSAVTNRLDCREELSLQGGGKSSTHGLVTTASAAASGQPNKDLESLSTGVHQCNSNQRRFNRRQIARGCNPAISAIQLPLPVLTLKYYGGYGTTSLHSRRQTPFQPMPPCRLFSSWPLPRPGSPMKTKALQLPSQLSTHSHTSRGKQVKEEELASSSSPCGPTRSFPWATYPDLLCNSTLSLSHFLSNLTLW